MAWVRIDENFAQHPKVLRAGPLGMAMHVAALCYCNRHLTDGFVPKQIASMLLDLSGLGMRMWSNETMGGGHDAEWQMVVDDLVEAGLWWPVEGGWHIHDYLDYQPSKQQVQRLKEVRSETGRRGGKQSASKREANSQANAQATAEANGQAKFNPDPDPVSQEERKSAQPAAARAAREEEPKEPTPREELAKVLDPLRVDAVLEHRKRKRAPLTAHAARLLAGKFGKCRDPNAAADAMISNGWQGFEPEWLENRKGAGPQSQKPNSSKIAGTG